MLTQAEDGSKSQTNPVNEHEVDITKPNDIEDNSTGTTWFGFSDCSTVSTTRTLHFSMQFLPGDYENSTNGASSTQIIMTLNHNTTLSSDSGDYRMTNMQRTYAMNDSVTAGYMGIMKIHSESADDEYSAAVNDTADPVKIDNQINIKVDSDDATIIHVSANTMFCTTEYIKLVAAEYSDDNSTFVAFASGSSEEEQTLYEKLKAYAIYVPILCVIVLAVIVIAVVVTRKKKQSAHGANWAKSQHDVEPIMGGQAAQPNADNHQLNAVAHAPAPTQDSRTAAL